MERDIINLDKCDYFKLVEKITAYKGNIIDIHFYYNEVLFELKLWSKDATPKGVYFTFIFKGVHRDYLTIKYSHPFDLNSPSS